MRRWIRPRRRWLALFGALAVLCCQPSIGRAWKPYTHNTSALEAYWDAVDDGYVTIEGEAYRVADGVAEALKAWPQFYNAGVIGPDGFPDLTYGQSVIHPGSSLPPHNPAHATGEWLRHVLAKAREAQGDPTYTDEQKQQILAFAYGYLTHAAGDMWGHSFINDFARGVFPGVKEILESPSEAGIAARHIIAEGYVGDATAGFDADRSDRNLLPDGDVSDDSTPGFPYDAPHRFIYDTLVDPNALTPSSARGPIIDFFLDLQSKLDGVAPETPRSVQETLEAYNEIAAAAAEVLDACTGGEASDVVNCPIALAKYGLENIEAFFEQIGAQIEDAATAVLDAYLAAWREDIDVGLENWGKFGLATTKGLFDAQTRRSVQNQTCDTENPDEGSLERANCESAVGLVDTVLSSADPFINQYLLSMAGLPDATGAVRQALMAVQSVIDEILGVLGLPFNPIEAGVAALKQEVQNLIRRELARVLGVDVFTLQEFLTQPHRFTCLTSVEIDLPELGRKRLELFAEDDHYRLDTLLGLSAAHHLPPDPTNPLPEDCNPLTDAAAWQSAFFKAMRNTVTTAKMLLLDGDELNRLLGTLLDRQIDTYEPEHNAMVQQSSFTGGSFSFTSWLRSIDGDHAWREDGLPRFCSEGGACPPSDVPTATPRPASLNGGAGTFPIWESCVLRPAFRTLFRDWETASGPFPDFGDASSSDLNDPLPPTSGLARTGTLFYTNGVDRFVGEDHGFMQTAEDTPVQQAFAAADLKLRRRIVPGGATPGAFSSASQGDTFTLGTVDGRYRIDLQAADACHAWAGAFPGSSAPDVLNETSTNLRSETFILDTTAPVISCGAPPFGRVFDSDDRITVDYGITDGPLGSGVAASSATVDGFSVLPGVVTTTDGASLDLSQFYPGTRTVAILSQDQLQHASGLDCTFVIQATAASLQTNVQNARQQGLITSNEFMNSLLDSLRVAARQHQRGLHETEWSTLEAFINKLMAQSGKTVDPTLATRLIAFARDIIAGGR